MDNEDLQQTQQSDYEEEEDQYEHHQANYLHIMDDNQRLMYNHRDQ